MFQPFWSVQDTQQKEYYLEMLKILGALTGLFSDSKSPYLYYRAHENLFCKVFEAKDLSRGDISYDALKKGIGIGLKTFLNNRGLTFQKVAEFNSDSSIIRELKGIEDIVHEVATMRNIRLQITRNMTSSLSQIYHLITREEGRMLVSESPMDPIDMGSIRIKKQNYKNSIHFSDKNHDYSYSLSKNTLFQRFDTRHSNIIASIDVEILTDPFDFLRSQFSSLQIHDVEEEGLEFIILPLYSPTRRMVMPKSGLNQWNAAGRPRDYDEVYIPIPIWIHRYFSDFFVYSRNRKDNPNFHQKDAPSFRVELPNQRVMSCTIAQENGKALMSNPNSDLGKWILREVLQLPKGHLVTNSDLEKAGIDSVKLSKKSDNFYYLDFMEIGSYEKFETDNKISE